MNHYELAVRHAPRLSAGDKRSLRNKIGKIKLSHVHYIDAIGAAMALSKLSCVAHVVIVQVNETAMGVWRKGKKS